MGPPASRGQGRRFRTLTFKQTTSGEDGEYEVEHLGGWCYEISAEHERLLPAATFESNWSDDGRSTEEVDLYLRAEKPSEGRVMDADGHPVRGAQVQAAFGPRTVRAGQTQEVLLEVGTGGGLRGVFREGGDAPGTRFRKLHATVSLAGRELYRLPVAPDGGFACSGLTPGEYGVSVWGTRADGGAVHYEKAIQVHESRVTEVRFDEPGRVVVSGRLSESHRSERHRPLAGLIVAAMDPWRDIETSYPWWNLTLASGVTDAEGRFQLPLPGGELCFLLLSGDGLLGQTQIELEVPDSPGSFQFERTLPSGALRGVVVEHGTAISVRDALVEVFDAASERRSYLSLVRARRGRCKTDYKGRFALKYLPPGDYSIRVGVRYGVQAWTHGVSVKTGESAETRIEWKPGITVSVNLIDRQGYPVTGVSILTRDQQRNLVAGPHFHTVMFVSSQRPVLDLPPLAPGSYELTFVHPRFASLRLPVEVNAARWLPSITLSEGGSLDLVVRDSSGSAVPEAKVLVLDSDGRDLFDDLLPALDPIVAARNPSPFTAADGRFRWEHLRPGLYRVFASKGTRSGETKTTIAEGKTAAASVTLPDA